MKRFLLLLFVVSLFVGNLSAQKARKDSTYIKLIVNGKFKMFRRFQADTTVFIRKDKKWFIQRNGEMMDTLDFSSKGQKKEDIKVKDIDKEISKGNVQVVVDSVTKKVTYKLIRYRFDGHWSGFEFGMNTILDYSGKMQLPDDAKLLALNTGKSWAFHWNFIQINAGIFKNKVGLVTGLGLNFNNYNFEKQVVINSRDSAFTFLTLDNVNSYKKNKLFIGYLTMPLLLEFQLHKKSRPAKTTFFLSAGVIGSVKIASRQKQIFADNRVYINKNDFNLNPFNLDGTARIGNNTFTLFANYSITTLFEKNKGPQLYPLTVGLGFVF